MSLQILPPDEDGQNPAQVQSTPEQHLNQRSKVLKYRLGYARRGIPTSPADVVRKKPKLTGWQEKATTDPRQIHMECNRWTEAGILLPTGKQSMRWVLDIDNSEDLKRLEEKLGVPLRGRTTEVRTTSGGMHLHWLLPEQGPEIRSSVGKIIQDGYEGLDTRGEGSLAILPPSAGYSFANQLPSVEAPSELVEWARNRTLSRCRDGEKKVRPRVEVPEGEPVYEGSRNNTIFWKCDRWHQELSEEEVEARALAFNEAYCKPPLPNNEVISTARSTCRYPVRSRGVSPEVEEILEKLWEQFYEEKLPNGGSSKERDCFRVALEFAGRFGTVIEAIIDGEVRRAVAVSISARQGAIPAAVSCTTFATNMKRLSAKGLIRPSGIKRKREEAKTWLILEPATQSYTSTSLPTREACLGVKVCRAPQRTPCFRWGGLVGNAAGGVLVAVERWGAQTAEELAERVGYSRGRDLKARHVDRLVEMGLLVEENGLYTLSGAYEEKAKEVKSTPYATTSRRRRKSRDGDRMVSWINEEVKVASEIERDRMDAVRHEDEQKAFRERLKAKENAEEEITAFLNAWNDERAWADGMISELSPVAWPEVVDGVVRHDPDCACSWCEDEPPGEEEVA